MIDTNSLQRQLGLFARRMCFNVFDGGRTPTEAFCNCGAPSSVLPELSYNVDDARRYVTLTHQGISRSAAYVGDQGSVVLPKNGRGVRFTPVAVKSRLPPADKLPWPMGDLGAADPTESSIRAELVEAAIKLAFDDPRNLTTAVVVVHRGKILGEQYALGITQDTQLECWSMGKSLLATVFALLVADGTYALDQPAPVPEWHRAGDPRCLITIRELLQMSSGLRFTTPDNVPAGKTADHSLAYISGIDIHKFARSRRLELPPPASKGRYANCDPWIIGSLLKDAVVSRGEEYLSFPQRALFDRIGIRRQVIEADPYGNLIFTGCDYGTARNWARLGLLYLQDGVWNSERILPEGWAKFVSTPAPAWKHQNYGGQFWLKDLDSPLVLPERSYFAAGFGHQFTFVIPKYDLVVVRMGHATGFVPDDSSQDESALDVGPGPSTVRMMQRLIELMTRSC